VTVIKVCLNGHAKKYDLNTLSDQAKEGAFEYWRCPVCKAKLAGITLKEGML
jgi:hypothetical protein